MQSKHSSLPPVIVAALFTLMLSACGNTKNIDEAPAVPADENQVMMESSEGPEIEVIEIKMDTEVMLNDEMKNDPDVPAIPSKPADENAMMRASKQAVVPKKSLYADGTFSADGSYRSPAGMEEIHVSLVIKNDIVTGATYEGTATNPKSVKYQGLFGQGFQEAVVGKAIDSLDLTVVNGSSLTPIGFMEALKKIEVEAAAKA